MLKKPSEISKVSVRNDVEKRDISADVFHF